MTRTTNARIAGATFFVYVAAGIASLVLAGRANASGVLAMFTTFSALVLGGTLYAIAGLMTFYFVTTGLLTVRPRARQSHWIDVGAMLFALIVVLLAFTAGLEVAKTGRPEAGPMFIFGAMGLLAAVGDVRMIRAGDIQGSRRIARHLWRMCFALFIASIAFFLGQGRVPEAIRTPALLAAGVLLPVVSMCYWLWRVRGRRSVRRIVRLSAPETA